MSESMLTLKLLERFFIERKRFDRSGIYAWTQRTLAYNSNKIEGSTLTEEQTAALFDDGVLPQSTDYYRAKDIEEMNGHFLMFNKMLDTFDMSLSENIIKDFHYELKSGVFEDRANGYAIGDYKKRPNIIGIYPTAKPDEVPEEMRKLLGWYSDSVQTDLRVQAEFHARYEALHPFQDGNGRTGRMILFRECLKNEQIPVIIEDKNRYEYIDGLKEYRETGQVGRLLGLLTKEQDAYKKQLEYFGFNVDFKIKE